MVAVVMPFVLTEGSIKKSKIVAMHKWINGVRHRGLIKKIKACINQSTNYKLSLNTSKS